MQFPNLLETKPGRMLVLSSLYFTEGLPWGFTSIAVATYLRSEGVGPQQIGFFTCWLVLPYAWKWVLGPFADTLYSKRFGRRRTWIVGAQVMMIGLLLLGMQIDPIDQLALFTAVVFLLNFACAAQDVAIDALACGVLKEEERGLANGLMFGANYLGTALGGGGVLYLSDTIPFAFDRSYVLVAAAILSVTLTISIRVIEPRTKKPASRAISSILAELAEYLQEAFRVMLGSRTAFLGMLLAAAPMGAYALSLQLQTAFAVELGLSDAQIGNLNMISGLISAAGCVVGGLLSDRFGRKRMLALFIFSTSLPTLYFAAIMHTQHWVMPIDVKALNRPTATPELLAVFWVAVLFYAWFQGLMGGTRLALFMDITKPEVAATQFTAYMALMNLATAYTAAWQGWAIESWGYPKTLVADSILGVLCIALLPWMRRSSRK